jgi:prepilin-type N-terminal cleavage/methylation domain-containing protein
MTRLKTIRSAAGHGSSLFGNRSDEGFTLAESIVALTLFVIVFTFGAIGVTQTIRLTGVTSARVAAANIATQEIERLRLANLTGHALVLTPPSGSVPSAYHVTNTIGTCASGVLSLTTAVTWGDNTRNVTYDSELAC